MTYQPGQYLSVHLTVDGVRCTRSYSLAGLPTDPALEIGVRCEPDGAVSPVLTRLTTGARVEVSGPHGRFVLDDHHPEVRPATLPMAERESRT